MSKSRNQVQVVVDQQVMSGEPCFEGTRIPVETVVLNLRAGHSAETIYASYPTLPLGSVEAAINWAEENGLSWS